MVCVLSGLVSRCFYGAVGYGVQLRLDAAAERGRGRCLAAAVLVTATLGYCICSGAHKDRCAVQLGIDFEHMKPQVAIVSRTEAAAQTLCTCRTPPNATSSSLCSLSSPAPHSVCIPIAYRNPEPLHRFPSPAFPILLLFCSPQAHLGAKVDGKLTMPNMPDLLTGPMDDPDSVTLALPDNSSVPLPLLPGVDLTHGVAAVVPGAKPGSTLLHTLV